LAARIVHFRARAGVVLMRLYGDTPSNAEFGGRRE
jgi:hypothetical protein